jgi:hypothetical protein
MLCALSSDQRLSPTASWPFSETPWRANSQGNAGFVLVAVSDLAGAPFSWATQPEAKAPIFDQTTHRQPPASPGQLPAGVYKTEPYTCIVVVPGPHPDDRCFVSPPGGECPMPVIQPDVQFIPLRPLTK